MHTCRDIDLTRIDELARRLETLVPPSQRGGHGELQENFKVVLQDALGRLHPVSRAELDALRTQVVRALDRVADVESELLQWRQSLPAAAEH